MATKNSRLDGTCDADERRPTPSSVRGNTATTTVPTATTTQITAYFSRSRRRRSSSKSTSSVATAPTECER